MVEVASSGGIFHRSDSEGALCARLVSSFPSSRWEDWRLVHLCCFGGAVTRLLEHSRVQTYESPWMASLGFVRSSEANATWVSSRYAPRCLEILVLARHDLGEH
jgi:hypothetical protein